MSRHEDILVVPRHLLDEHQILPAKPGCVPASHALGLLIEELVAAGGQFLPRPLMEVDPTYKQIIPYMVFVHDRRVYVMQRSGAAGEQRLANKYTVGIGGHVRAGDLLGSGKLVDWGTREFAEEIAYDGSFKSVQIIGLVNDDRDAVGQVHLGIVFLLAAESGDIAIRSELKSGMLMGRAECLAVHDRMETWSQFVVDMLVAKDLI